MIKVIRPFFGSICESDVELPFERNGKFYVRDVYCNIYETTKEEYELKCRGLGKHEKSNI